VEDTERSRRLRRAPTTSADRRFEIGGARRRYARLMSKAFTKESDDGPESVQRRRGVPVPIDVPNYITAAGERALRAELAAPHDAERAREVGDHLATAIVMEGPADRSRVGFGATVTVEDEHGAQHKYRIVGAIEASPKQGAIYWRSPIALALHDAQVGDSVALPRGEVEVVAIDYA
jgi:transcription elongation factor GreB